MRDPIARATCAATAARDAEGVVRDRMAILQATLGQRTIPLPPDVLEPGQNSFSSPEGSSSPRTGVTRCWSATPGFRRTRSGC